MTADGLRVPPTRFLGFQVHSPTLGQRGDLYGPPFRYGSRMEHKYEVRFAKGDPETPPTMEEQIALARAAARRLGEPRRGEPGARQPSSASVYSKSNPPRNSLAARLDPNA